MPVNPFRGLAYYNSGDTLYERDADVDLVSSRLWAGRYTILFAGSGVGKTSFLKAKLIGTLRDILGSDNVTFAETWTKGDPVEALALLRQQTFARSSVSGTHVIILDQFEEVFQTFPDVALLGSLGRELARFSKTGAGDIRILISTREEFLAELSSFEDFLPGLFTNYYRLERLTLSQAKAIIIKTVAGVGVEVDERLQWLLEDLSNLKLEPSRPQSTIQALKRWFAQSRHIRLRPEGDPGADISGSVTAAADRVQPLLEDPSTLKLESSRPQRAIRKVTRWFAQLGNIGSLRKVNPRSDIPSSSTVKIRTSNVIDPPYLQIVCQRLWTRENPDTLRAFLHSYRRGEAAEQLRSFTNEKLGELPPKQRLLLSKAVGHLTGPHEAKKYMPLAELAKETRIHDVAMLKKSLEALCTARILQERGEVYGLYHDMYAPMLWMWRETEVMKQQKMRLLRVVIYTLIVSFLIIYPLGNLLQVRQALNSPDYGNRHEFSHVLEMRNALSYTIIWRWLGDILWSEYNNKLMNLASLRLDSDAATLYRLAALSTRGKPESPFVLDHTLRSERDLLGTLEPGTPDTLSDVAFGTTPNDKHVIVKATVGGKFIKIPLDGSEPTSDEVVLPSQRPQIKVLALSPAGKTALVARIGADDLDRSPCLRSSHTGTHPHFLVHLATYDVYNGLAKDTNDRVLSSCDFEEHESEENQPNSGGNSVKNGLGGIPTSALNVLLDIRAVFSDDSGKVAVSAGSTSFVFDYDDVAGVLGEMPPIQIKSGVFAHASFSPHHNFLAIVIRSEPPQQNRANSGERLRLFKINKGNVYKPLPQGEAPYNSMLDSKVIFSDDERMLLRDGDALCLWSFFTKQCDAIGSLQGISGMVPQFIDDKVIVVTDSLGKIIVIPRKNQGKTFFSYPSSEPRASFLSPETRELTVASLHNLHERRMFVSLEEKGRLARVWSLRTQSPYELSVLQVSLSSRYGKGANANGCKPGESLGVTACSFYSDGDVYRADIIKQGGTTAAVIVKNAVTMQTSWRWSIAVPDKVPQAATVSATGHRVLLWYRDKILYAEDSEASARCFNAGSQFISGVLGPGKDAVTFLTDEFIKIYHPKESWQPCKVQSPTVPSSDEPVAMWEADTGGVKTNVKASGAKDEAEVVVYSSRWAHRIRQGYTDWPVITDMFADIPLNPEDRESATISMTFRDIDGKAKSAFDIEDEFYNSDFQGAVRSLFRSPWRLNLCEENDRSRGFSTLLANPGSSSSMPPDWRSVMCQVEVRSNRRTGASLSQEGFH